MWIISNGKRYQLVEEHETFYRVLNPMDALIDLCIPKEYAKVEPSEWTK